ncbi:bifunctional phosphopantothenoylcysteine decarboxylase/phosphopantothenate--cysteine ligase CoaBC [Ichthyobacterium seriolicida]|uniref:Coenzyme A biosynthesis bifunctional protein CoaBC n=1 Tax=Ichthyobacterium seriolicida TaxID=242600 RepID=A0A1J1DWN9_9FLAO|nr:bifunctional phosphopantothenoylcysteine decarboxylase/phosphopantothenate--cysteine ligase CoaBC [Ichthyobacterium seriolicida]BAV94274.1 phosphopantothenoylcysteine decarboxylase [Ichthyobacterium seriolicida]
MSFLKGKKILLGVSGGIAAYKIPHLVRLLIKAEAQVKILMTHNAVRFVSPLTLSVLSKNDVHISSRKEGVLSSEQIDHIELSLWADMILIAPATANTIAKMSRGLADNPLILTYLSARCDVYISPAMDLYMCEHPSTKKNLDTLRSFGNRIIPMEKGELASGLVGLGRMAEPEHIVSFIKEDISKKTPLHKKKILVTAGPTREYIDPVRAITNFSSGKMGFAIAQEAANMGAEVVLITGPVHLKINHKNIKRIDVTSAEDMYNEIINYFDNTDILIMSAAVSDYKIDSIYPLKLKKSEDIIDLRLVKNIDILKSLGKKKKGQLIVGFALETDNELENAKQKLLDKNADIIILNSLNDKGAGFNYDTNKINIISKNEVIDLPLKSKNEIAIDILEYCCSNYMK